MSRRMTDSLRRLRAALLKAASLSGADWWRMWLGQVALLRALRDVRDRPQGELTRKDADAGALLSVTASERARARLVVLGVTRAAAYGMFTPTCLVKSMAITGRLKDAGIAGAVLRVGVARRKGQFVAHAWVELGGEVIGDDASAVERYEPLDGLQVTSLT